MSGRAFRSFASVSMGAFHEQGAGARSAIGARVLREAAEEEVAQLLISGGWVLLAKDGRYHLGYWLPQEDTE